METHEETLKIYSPKWTLQCQIFEFKVQNKVYLLTISLFIIFMKLIFFLSSYSRLLNYRKVVVQQKEEENCNNNNNINLDHGRFSLIIIIEVKWNGKNEKK